MNVVRWTGREARLLRLAMRLGQREFAAKLGLSDTAVASYERPQRRDTVRLRYETQQLLDTVLAQAGQDVRDRFQAARAAERSTAAADPAPLPEGPTIAGAPVPAFLPGRTNAGAGGAFDHRTADGHREIAETLASMYRSVDARTVLVTAAAYADELLAWYEERSRPEATDLAVAVVGVHCQVGLWACHTDQPGLARRYLAAACDVAAGAGDRVLHARALGALAYLHSSAPRGGRGGNPRRALELLGQALALAARADGFTRGWLATWRADQHATLGDLVGARADLELADAVLDDGDDPGTGFFARRHYGYGMRGHLDSVRGLVHALAAGLDESERVFATVQAAAANSRRRIASFGHQALGYAKAAESEAACVALDGALTLIGTEPYPMGLRRVIGIRAGFDPAWAGLRCVRQLDERLASLPPAAAGIG